MIATRGPWKSKRKEKGRVAPAFLEPSNRTESYEPFSVGFPAFSQPTMPAGMMKTFV
jgi:hypothetical protein